MFDLNRDNMYHMTHNTAIADELLFLLNNIDLTNKFYTFPQLTKLLFIEEVKQDKFETFHPQPYSNLNRINRVLYLKFKADPEKYYDKIINLKYSPTKTWKQNWVEFVRDYVDFAAYCGLLPCYYKTPGNRASENDGYLVSGQLKRFRNNEISFERILLDYKYSNTSINIDRFKQFNIKVRPFYIGLKILESLKKKGINSLERRLFFAVITCAKNENIDEIVNYLANWIKTNGNILNETNHTASFAKEGGRVATGMQDFYLKYNLLERINIGSCQYFSITDIGSDLLKEVPPNAMYFGEVEVNTGLLYSPLVANILLKFTLSVKKNILTINKKELLNSFSTLNEETFNMCLGYLQEITPSPIQSISGLSIKLNDFSHQYHVVPYNDFANYNDIIFVESTKIDTSIERYGIEKIELPDQRILDELLAAAHSSEGTRYELALNEALRKLPGNIDYFGASTTGERYSDIVWKISMPTTEGPKTYLVIFEAKSGSAIRSFNERNVIPQIENTLKQYKSDFRNVEGIWYVIVDSNQLPREGRHGGSRKNSTQLNLSQKLFIIQQSINNLTGRTTIVTAFGIDAFIEYYKYLFAMSRPTFNENNISSMYIKHFFNTGEVFTNYNTSYSCILNDSNDINSFLNYG
jgi:hypothetical protein